MKAYEITLKMGVVRVRQDEIKELMGTLATLEPGPPVRPSANRKQGFLDYEAAKAILAPKFGDDQRGLARRFSPLWLTISRLASNGDIAYDAECRFCGTRLDRHGRGSFKCANADRKIRMVVTPGSLRVHMAEFMSELSPAYRIGAKMREDYAFLVEHLPAD
jgi:hypothetical protein